MSGIERAARVVFDYAKSQEWYQPRRTKLIRALCWLLSKYEFTIDDAIGDVLPALHHHGTTAGLLQGHRITPAWDRVEMTALDFAHNAMTGREPETRAQNPGGRFR